MPVPPRLPGVDASDQRPAQPAPAQPFPSGQPIAPSAPQPSTPAVVDAAATGPVVNDGPAEFLPTMADLDRLAADLDRVDLTLAQLDDPLQHAHA